MSHDEKLILEYLEEFPGEFVSPMEIAKRAGSRERYKTQPGWARTVLQRLEQQYILEQDHHGHFRIKEKRAKTVRTAEPRCEAPEAECVEPAKSHHYWLGPSVVEVDDDQSFASILQSLAIAWPSTKKIKKA